MVMMVMVTMTMTMTTTTMMIFLLANIDDDEDLEMLHLDWITARPYIAWTLAATINTAAILTRMLIMTHKQKHNLQTRTINTEAS